MPDRLQGWSKGDYASKQGRGSTDDVDGGVWV